MEPGALAHGSLDGYFALMVDLGPAADAKGIVLGGIVNNSGQEVPHISADPMALREVFSNLLENAVKHNGAGTEISAEVRQQNEKLYIDLKDNGKGVPPEILGNIFAQGSRSYHPGVNRGTGMGLFLCKLLVELHQGEITARGTEGQGTGFHIVLQVRRN